MISFSTKRIKCKHFIFTFCGIQVIIIGPQDSGKSTLATILTSYAARLDRSPILVDLDVGQSMASISGAMCALPIEKTNLSIEVSTTCLCIMTIYNLIPILFILFFLTTAYWGAHTAASRAVARLAIGVANNARIRACSHRAS